MINARTITNVSLLVPLALLAVYTPTISAADRNGYNAAYECRAGGPACNVDVAGLATRACDQVVTPSMAWSSINWSLNTICLAPGDHTGKGTLEIPGWANGNAGSYKVLRHQSGESEPWQQSGGEQAQLRRLVVRGNYWLLHRLTLPPLSGGLEKTVRLEMVAGSGSVSNIIVNRVLIEGSHWDNYAYYGISQDCQNSSNYDRITIQNSVLRNYYGGTPLWEAVALDMQCGSNLRAVNNEIYDWAAHTIQTGSNSGPHVPGLVIENNDLYQSPVVHTQGGARMRAEDPLSIKSKSNADSPMRVIHNRIWGSRWADLAYCCNGSDGGAIKVNGDDDNYILFANNIIYDSQNGIIQYPTGSHNHSLVGNIFYKINRYDSGQRSHALPLGIRYSEIYLNSFIANGDYALSMYGHDNNDIMCNAFVSAGAREGGAPPSSTRADFNVFYDTPAWSFNGSYSGFDIPVTTRGSNTGYAGGAIARWGNASACTSGNEPACFLYKATDGGTTGGSATPCTELGCTFDDGGVRWQAIRGPYVFYRKLRTSGERYVIPYARVHTSAPEARACPSDYAGRRSVGINDDM